MYYIRHVYPNCLTFSSSSAPCTSNWAPDRKDQDDWLGQVRHLKGLPTKCMNYVSE